MVCFRWDVTSRLETVDRLEGCCWRFVFVGVARVLVGLGRFGGFAGVLFAWALLGFSEP